MALLAVSRVSLDGANPTFVAATAGAGDNFPNTGREYLHVINGSGGSINVTVAATAPCNHGTTHNVVVAVPAGQQRRIGPFPTSRFGDNVVVTYSAVTTVTVAAIGF